MQKDPALNLTDISENILQEIKQELSQKLKVDFMLTDATSIVE